MAYPTIDQLKAMVRMNMIRDSPVTLADVDLIEKIWQRRAYNQGEDDTYCPNNSQVQNDSYTSWALYGSI